MSKDRIIKEIIKAAGPKNVIVITAQDFKEILATIAGFAPEPLFQCVVDTSKLKVGSSIDPGCVQPIKPNVPSLKNLNKDEIKKVEVKKDETKQK